MTNLKKVLENPYEIVNMENPSIDICLAAVKQDGAILKHIEKQTAKICLEAVKNYFFIIIYIKEKEHFLEVCENLRVEILLDDYKRTMVNNIREKKYNLEKI